MEADPFDDVLSLEDQFYAEGHQLGVADGSKAGRIEGRIFGLEKGLEKFMAMGKLHGRAAVWSARLADDEKRSKNMQNLGSTTKGEGQPIEDGSNTGAPDSSQSLSHVSSQFELPFLQANSRLRKHIHTLYALVEPASISTSNNEDAVSDFDDRFKRAQAKAKVIERLVGETGVDDETGSSRQLDAFPDASRIRLSGADGGGASIEDFAGRRGPA